jgi:tetratricopeptide (TPR) repeat protein
MFKRLAVTISAGLFLLAGSALFSATGVVKGSYINVRSDAKFDAPIIGKKMRGDRYEVEFSDKYWVKVKFNDGTRGWIYKTLIERVGEVPEPEETAKPEQKEPDKKEPAKTAKPAKPTPEKKVEKKVEKKQKKSKKTQKVEKPAVPAPKKVPQKAKPAEIVEVSGTAEELYNQAIRLYEKRKYAQALEKNRQALKKAPKNGEIINNIGNCLFKMGRIQDALDTWKEALKITPKSGKISNNLGIAYYQLDKNKDAIEYYKKAILFEPQFPDPYYNLASVYGFTGKFADAILNYRKFLEFDPEPVMKKLAEERISYCERQVAKTDKKKD